MAGRNPTRRAKVRVTKKQMALVKAAINNPDATLAEIGHKAGYQGTDGAVSSAANRAFKSANVQDTFRAAMALRPKLQHEALLKKLEEGLDATQTKLFAHEGRIVDSEELIDYPTRGTYLALAAKLNGASADKLEVTGAGGRDLIPAVEPLPSLTREQLLALIALPDGLADDGGDAGKPA